MPFRGHHEGEVVVPAEIADQQPVECPDCGGKMYPREGDDVARHFYHASADLADTCGNTGESDVHFRCKALAVAALKQQWGDQADHCGVEVTIDVPYTPTSAWQRFADALLSFESRNQYFGQGIVIEVKHKNDDKDARKTSHDYIAADYSVVWLTPEDFGSESLDYAVVDEAFRSSHHQAPVDWDAPRGTGCNVRYWTPNLFGRNLLPDDIDQYQRYPNTHTDVSEHRYSFMKAPWR
jgi:hypothetical protein